MRPLPRSVIFWTLFALLMLGAWLMCRAAPTQGAGALKLVRDAKQSQSLAAMTPPTAIIIPPKIFYFAATARADELESDYSNEVSLVRTGSMATVTLAWDASASTNVDGYAVHKGRESGVYTNTYDAGTNLTLTVSLLPPPAPSNFVVTVTSGRCTNLLYAPTLQSQWTLAGYTNLVATNPTWGRTRYWRGIGRPSATNKTVTITKEWK
jgi:hypothetical protein